MYDFDPILGGRNKVTFIMGNKESRNGMDISYENNNKKWTNIL